MLWLYLAILAYFLNAVAFVVDKYLLTSSLPRTFVYTFWVAVLSSTIVFLIPFGITWFGLSYFLISLVSGIGFFLALIFFYKSVKLSEISVASAKTGAFTGIFSFVFSILILRETFSLNVLFAFFLLTLGIFFLSRVKKEKLKHSVVAGLFFGISFVLLKWTFNVSDFINGVFWTRVGFIIGALVSLFIASARKEIIAGTKGSKPISRVIFIVNKFIVGVGFLILYYSIRLGDVAIVNALLGFQFIFILFLVWVLRNKIPNLGENFQRTALVNKILGVVSIFVGFVILFYFN